MEFRYIQYIGKQTDKHDRLYGTGVKWSQYGDIEPVPADKAPQLLQHPDEFVEVDDRTYQEFVAETDEQGIDTDALKRARRRVAEGRKPSVEPDETDGAGLADANEGGGAGEEQGRLPQKPDKPVSQLSKTALIEYAEREFGESIGKSESTEDVRVMVKEMMAKHGLR